MKRILVIGSIAALAVVGMTGTANAAQSEKGSNASCFGQVHKDVNAGVYGVANVGELVGALGGGQAKNMLAKSLCA